MKISPHIQNILKNSKKDTEWNKEAEERLQARNESTKSGLIATQLAIYMAENKISQTALGKMTGVSPQQISKVLKGKENLTLSTIEKIEDALGVQLIQVNILEEAELKRQKEKNESDIKYTVEKADLLLNKLMPIYSVYFNLELNFDAFLASPILINDNIFMNSVSMPSRSKIITVKKKTMEKFDASKGLSPYVLVAET